MHDQTLDPSQHRQGKTAKTDTCDLDHNHPPPLPQGAQPKPRPSENQKDILRTLATNVRQTFSRAQAAEVLSITAPDEPKLEGRQISYFLTKQRKEAREAIKEQGGDCQAIADDLRKKQEGDARWRFEVSISRDGSGIVDGVFWQSPIQCELADRYGDVLIFDSAYNRNNAGFPLSIGIVIDGFCHSRNVFYALTATETSEQVKWILQCYLRSAKRPPTTFMSDRHGTLLIVIPIVLPLTDHLFCLSHLLSNIDQNLRRAIGGRWAEFMDKFWKAYRAVSPEMFTERWEALVASFPEAAAYLTNELWPCRERWAWTFVAHKFTVGSRTNGRVESENRVSKSWSGAKTSLYQLYAATNKRTDGQSLKDMCTVRDSSRQKHPSQIETVFPGPLSVIRKHVGPFGLQICFREMESSLYYTVEALQIPAGFRYWTEDAIIEASTGFEWEKGEENRMSNLYENDGAHIGSKWLLRLVVNQGLRVTMVLRVSHLGTGKTHILAFMDNQTYVCDCTMGLSLGLPCRHYFHVLSSTGNLRFHLSVINRRWFQNHDLDINSVPSVTAREADLSRISSRAQPVPLANNSQTNDEKPPVAPSITHRSAVIASNPLYHPFGNDSRPPPTQTLPAREVYHETSALVRSLAKSVRTEEELDRLKTKLIQISNGQSDSDDSDSESRLKDPPVLNAKGRPLSTRLTGPTEGRPRGGGGTRSRGNRGEGRKCGVCRKEGHTKTKCPRLRSSTPE